MEFLVNMRIRWPHDMPPEQQREIREREHVVRKKYAAEGKLIRLWRVPGQRTQTWALWDTADATELHELISALAVWRWLDEVTVHPLARHPVDPGSP
jgi:muconolactone D-isomerase